MCIRDRIGELTSFPSNPGRSPDLKPVNLSQLTGGKRIPHNIDRMTIIVGSCLLYTSDAADERSSVDLGGRRIIKQKNKKKNTHT